MEMTHLSENPMDRLDAAAASPRRASLRAHDRQWRRTSHLAAWLIALDLTLLLVRPDRSLTAAHILGGAAGAASLALLHTVIARSGLYASPKRFRGKLALAQLVSAALIGIPLLVLDGSRRWPAAFALFLAVEFLLFLAAEEIFAASFRPSSLFSLRPVYVVVWGRDSAAAHLMERLAALGPDWRVAACSAGMHTAMGAAPEACTELDSIEDLRDFLFRSAVDVVLATGPANDPALGEVARAALELGLRFALLDGPGVSMTHLPDDAQIEHSRLCDLPLIVCSSVPWRPGYLVVKRLIDVAVSAAALLCLSPLLLMIAAAIKIHSPHGPVFYRLLQVGLNRRPIVCYKFRSMVPNADALQAQLLSKNEMQGPVFKIREDPRIMPLGRFLRRYSLDELPQIFSVLSGDLSLVGPRAPLRTEAEKFAYWQRGKLAVKPGLTCFWQVGGRSKIANFDDWIQLDLQYVHSASLLVDLKILLRTIPVVLLGDGAY